MRAKRGPLCWRCYQPRTAGGGRCAGGPERLEWGWQRASATHVRCVAPGGTTTASPSAKGRSSCPSAADALLPFRQPAEALAGLLDRLPASADRLFEPGADPGKGWPNVPDGWPVAKHGTAGRSRSSPQAGILRYSNGSPRYAPEPVASSKSQAAAYARARRRCPFGARSWAPYGAPA